MHFTIFKFGAELYLFSKKEASLLCESRFVTHIMRLCAAFRLDSGSDICAKSS